MHDCQTNPDVLQVAADTEENEPGQAPYSVSAVSVVFLVPDLRIGVFHLVRNFKQHQTDIGGANDDQNDTAPDEGTHRI